MKKIINGKQYNTETAKQQGRDSDSYPGRLEYWSETLYKTKSGNWFLYGEGGAMSRYAEATGDNNWSGGEMIIPMTETAAKEWAEEHLDGDDYEKVFGEIEDDGVQISATISQDLKDKFDAEKAKTGETTAELISRLIEAI